MEIKLYFRMLQRGWWIVLLTIFAAMIVALFSAYMATPVYEATSRFSVNPNLTLALNGTEILNSMQALDKRSIIQTYAEFLNSQRVYDDTIKSLNIDPSTLVNYTHSTNVVTDANVLELTVTGTNANLVAELANKIGENAIDYIKQINQVYDISVLDPAQVPVIPVSPQPLRDTGVAALLGLIIGAALAIMSEQIKVPLDAYRNLSRMDPVSQVFNRRYIQNRLEENISQKPGDIISLGMIRLNGLNELIDTLPEGMVQQLLREVTNILKKELRGNDLIGRWDRTTFLLILPTTPEIAAVKTLGRIKIALLNPINLVNYGETVLVDPVTSVASYKDGEKTGDIIHRLEQSLDFSHTQIK